MSEIKQLKRFIYSATVTSGSGSQSFYIDAKNREEADKRAANNESDGMYADDSEVTDLDALEYEDETTVDDFGDFPLISREQSLIAQLEAAQLELIKPLPIGELLHRLEGQTYRKWYDDDELNKWRERAEKAEAELSAANERIEELELNQIEQNDANSVLSAALDAANEKLSKPVVLPIKSPDAALNPREYPNFASYGLGYNDAINECVTAIKAAGFTVEGE